MLWSWLIKISWTWKIMRNACLMNCVKGRHCSQGFQWCFVFGKFLTIKADPAHLYPQVVTVQVSCQHSVRLASVLKNETWCVSWPSPCLLLNTIQPVHTDNKQKNKTTCKKQICCKCKRWFSFLWGKRKWTRNLIKPLARFTVQLKLCHTSNISNVNASML